MKCEDILRYEPYREFNRNTFDMIINAARTLAINEMLPLLADMKIKQDIIDTIQSR